MSEDHDLLIRVDTHLGNLGKQICKIERTTDDIYKQLDEQKDNCAEIQRKNFDMLDKRPKFSLILWLFGGVFFCLLMLGGFIFDNRNTINEYHPTVTQSASSEESN